MRRSLWLVVVCLLAAPMAMGDELQFEAHLSPYGEWVAVPHYGRVWRPYQAVVGVDFEPYSTSGHWVFTDRGWTFDSELPFAWATYHYGRWYQDPLFGWVWAPGDEWAPAWVEWRLGGGYVGWMPMAPVGIEVVFPAYRPRWAFVETRYLVTVDPWRHRLDEHRAREAFHGAVPVGPGVNHWSVGPPASHVAIAAGVEIRPARLMPPPRGQLLPPRPPEHPGVPPPPTGFVQPPREQVRPPPPVDRSNHRDGPDREGPPPPAAQHREVFAPPPSRARDDVRANPPRQPAPPPPAQPQAQPQPPKKQPSPAAPPPPSRDHREQPGHRER